MAVQEAKPQTLEEAPVLLADEDGAARPTRVTANAQQRQRQPPTILPSDRPHSRGPAGPVDRL